MDDLTLIAHSSGDFYLTPADPFGGADVLDDGCDFLFSMTVRDEKLVYNMITIWRNAFNAGKRAGEEQTQAKIKKALGL